MVCKLLSHGGEIVLQSADILMYKAVAVPSGKTRWRMSS